MKPRTQKNRFFAVILSMVMLLCCIPGVSANAVEQETVFAELISSQEQAVKASEALTQFFFSEGWGLEYPDYFGGCYIEDNILHIRLVEPTAEESKILNAVLVGYEDSIVFEGGSYAQASIQDYADSAAAELKARGLRVTHWYAEVQTGNVIIGVLPDDIDSANSEVAKFRDHSLKDIFPKIVIEEGGYTAAQ